MNSQDLVPTVEGHPAEQGSDEASSSKKTCYRLRSGKAFPCRKEGAEIVCYTMPGSDEEDEIEQLYNIDRHTLQSAVDPDELSRLEFEPDHAAIIFKRPKSYCADDNFLLKVTSTGVFLYNDLLVVVMPDDSTLFEGRVPFPVNNLRDVILRLLYQSILHFEGHLKAISMLSDSIEKRLTTSMENRYLLNMFSLEKSLVYILNSLSSNTSLCDKLRTNAGRLGFDEDQLGALEDIAIETKQCFRRAQIYTEVLGGLMDARASVINNNLNQLMKKLTIITLAVMLPNLVISLFSMNVRMPFPQNEGMWPFWMIFILAAATAVALLWFWRIKKW